MIECIWQIGISKWGLAFLVKNNQNAEYIRLDKLRITIFRHHKLGDLRIPIFHGVNWMSGEYVPK